VLLSGGGGGVVRGLEEGTAVYIVTMKQAAASHKRLDLERFGGSSVAASGGGGGGDGDTPATSVLRKPRCGPLLADISLIVLGLCGCVNFPLLQLAC
jgi:hypothetical protein